ncbi:MAG: sulfatase [Verrucomicrobia bacterium]|nr:sulfatase [Verrucomicrobiota bacterium]
MLKTLTALVLTILATALPAQNAGRPPNVIVILVDDWGTTDLGCYGSKLYETPNIDRLASEGVRFTTGYSACTVCSPTRAALMTGKYPARLHLTDWIAGHGRPHAKLKIPDWTKFMKHEEVTLAEQFKAAGYATASIGKWHLTPALDKGDEAYYPETHGFDVNVGGYHRGQPPSYFSPYKIPTLKEGPDGEFLTDREATEAAKFIETNRAKPFFIYLPHYAVHTPIQSKKDVAAKYAAKLEKSPSLAQRNASYAALVESVDDALGTIRKALEKNGLTENTVIVITGDNGGLLPITDNAPLRAGKGSAYEGGVRVPFIVAWPGKVAPKVVSEVPAVTIDIYPTVLELAGIRPMQSLVDGISLAPLLTKGSKPERDTVFWHYPHYHPGGATPYSAVRSGDLRLVHFYEDGRDELYDLANDIGETKDLAAAQPALAKTLRSRLDAWLKSVDAQLPTKNPAYDPSADANQGKKNAKAKKK